MTITTNHAMNFNHILGSQAPRTANAGSANGNQSIDFDHILNSQGSNNANSGSANAPQTAGFDHILNLQALGGLGGLRNAPGDRQHNAGSNHILGTQGPGLGGAPDTDETISGTVSSSKNGDGSFNKVIEETNGAKVVDTTVTYANGKTKEVEKSITVNADGSKTITKTNAHGKTSTIDTSKSRDADGNVVVSREATDAKGHTTDTTMTVSKSATGEVDRSITRTNAKGETETLDRMTSNADGVRTVTTTGTGYDGSTINNETTWTTVA